MEYTIILFSLLVLLQNETTVNEQHSILIRWSSDLNCSQSLYLYEQQLSAGSQDHSLNIKPENKIQSSTIQTNDSITWTCLISNLTQETKYYYSIVEDGKALDNKRFPRIIKSIKTDRLKLVIITNIGNDASSKDYIEAVSAFIRFSPDDFDAIVDIGGQYVQRKIKANSNQNVTVEDDLTKYLPLTLTINENNEEINQFFNYNLSQGLFLNTSLVQIKYLSSDLSTASSQFKSKEIVFAEPNQINKIRIIFANNPFYCSKESEKCQSGADRQRNLYEKQFSDQHVQLVISGQGDGEYERTLPIFEGIPESIDNKNDFEESLSMPVYITTNGAIGSHSTLTSKKNWAAAFSSEPSFGVLEIKSKYEVKYLQYSDDHEILDHFTLNIIVEEEDNTFVIYAVYGILVMCVAGFGFFIYNWIKCFLSRPSKNDSDSSDSEGETVKSKKRKRVNKEEIELAMP